MPLEIGRVNSVFSSRVKQRKLSLDSLTWRKGNFVDFVVSENLFLFSDFFLLHKASISPCCVFPLCLCLCSVVFWVSSLLPVFFLTLSTGNTHSERWGPRSSMESNTRHHREAPPHPPTPAPRTSHRDVPRTWVFLLVRYDWDGVGERGNRKQMELGFITPGIQLSEEQVNWSLHETFQLIESNHLRSHSFQWGDLWRPCNPRFRRICKNSCFLNLWGCICFGWTPCAQ